MTRNRPAWVDRHISLMMGLLTAFVVTTVLLSFHVWPAHAATGPVAPYADAQATGFLTLYDKSGAAIKSGTVAGKPFVWKAVGSKAAVAPYDKAGRKATLMAYQPRTGVAPGSWSGDSLTASTAYTDLRHPAVQATASDFTLKDFLDEFPPQWNGTIQLRLYLTAPGMQPLTTGYSSTDIKISGTTWVVVGGGPGAGTGGKDIPGKIDPAAAAAAGITPSGSASARPSGSAVPDPSTSAVAAGDTGGGADPVALIGDLPYLRTPGYVLVAAALLVAFIFGAVLIGRRRRYAEEW